MITYPVLVDEETLQSKIKIRACYEGTVNTSRLFLRENGKFEDFNIGFFALVRYTNGTWNQTADTIFLKYKKEKPKNLYDTLVIKDETIYAIQNDSLVYSYYYLGECKGLN
jgi:hypothetical protein